MTKKNVNGEIMEMSAEEQTAHDNDIAQNAIQLQQEQEAEESNEEPVEESVGEFGNCGAHKKEEFGNCNSHKKEGFTNRVLFGKRFLSLDLALRAVLYALLFYIVSHSDTQALLKGVVKRLPKVVKPFAPMLLFGVLYYVLNLFI